MPSKFMCTVLLISYNHKDTISRAIESILEQDTQYPFKIHAFDDGSTDGTKEIIATFSKEYPDIFFPFIAEKNQGAQTNYWNAFASVDTPYCVLLEGDDFYCNPQKIELQIKALEDHPYCSFCGHDTYLFSNGEAFREYEEGAKAMTAPLLKTKDVFTYQDFVPITTGGYIPYGSARMIRTSALKLDEIKYKEAVLFDFSQFYFLLLQGDYYYIDLPMSAYVRNGTGICSGKSPLAFLNEFMQGAIDFNRQTNNTIADKIYSDCMLQISFRMNLFYNSGHSILYSAERLSKKNQMSILKAKAENTHNLYILQGKLSKDYYYYLCNGGLGHTMALCAYRDELEKKLGAKVVLLVRSEHTFIPDMYRIKDYIEVDLQNANLQHIVSVHPNPEKGEIYVTHPFSHPEAANYFRPIHGLYSTVRYLPWLLKFMGIQETLKFAMPVTQPPITRDLEEKIRVFGCIDKLVLFFPESNTLPRISHRIWKKKAKELMQEGLTILSCVTEKRNVISGTHYCDLTAKEAVAIGMHCHSVYCTRNGMADLLVSRGSDLHVYYPLHNAFFIYAVSSMYDRRDVDEKIVLEVEADTHTTANNVGPKHPRIFGILPVPEWCYQFYLRHKGTLKFFKKFIKWQ